MSGWIKDYRKELDSNIWLMPPLYHRVWQYLKYKANHAPGTIPMHDGTMFVIQIGQHLTSLRNIAKGVGWWEGSRWKEPNPKTVSTILGWMEKQKMIVIDNGKGNRQYTLVTIANWGLYQVKDKEGNSKVTVEKQCADINKNNKNDNNMLLSIYKGENPESYLQEYFPNFYQWIEKNNYTEKAKHPNEEPYYLKYLHEKANFLSKLKGKDHVETINAIKAFENRKATAAEGAILKAQSISEKKVGGD